MAVVLGGLMVWFWRLTRPVPVALGGLAVMGTSRWQRSPRQVQDDLVSSVRAEPLAVGAPAAAATADDGDAALDPDLAPLVPVIPLDGSFEWPPAATAEEIAALAPQYRWARPVRRAEVVGPPAVPTSSAVPVVSPVADDEAIPDLFADVGVSPPAVTPSITPVAQPLPPPLPSPSVTPAPSDATVHSVGAGGSTERGEDDGR